MTVKITIDTGLMLLPILMQDGPRVNRVVHHRFFSDMIRCLPALKFCLLLAHSTYHKTS